jgi:hypothetical protein
LSELKELEIQPQGKLDLPTRAEPNVTHYRLTKQAKRTAGGCLRITLPRLHNVAGAQSVDAAALSNGRQRQV